MLNLYKARVFESRRKESKHFKFIAKINAKILLIKVGTEVTNFAVLMCLDKCLTSLACQCSVTWILLQS